MHKIKSGLVDLNPADPRGNWQLDTSRPPEVSSKIDFSPNPELAVLKWFEDACACVYTLAQY